MMLRPFRMDLHIHTCLSPCGMPENVPTRIIAKTQDRKLQAIGICDHNASENVAAVRRAADDSDIRVFGGIEVTTEEEIHILAVFDNDDDLNSMQNLVYENLSGKNDPDAFGQQYIVNEKDYVTGVNERLLMGATNLSLDRIIYAIHQWKGLAIASHIDRDAFSIISQLGMIPDNLELDAVELSSHYMNSQFELENTGFRRVMFSDAHQLEDIGTVCTDFIIESPSVMEIKKALQGLEGRETVSPL